MYAGANRKSSLQKLTGGPIIASCHKTSASQGRGFCELSFISSFFQALCSPTLLAITSASLSLAQPIATYGICSSRSHEIRAAAAVCGRSRYPPVALCQMLGRSCDSIVDRAGSKNGIVGELLAVRLANESRRIRLGGVGVLETARRFDRPGARIRVGSRTIVGAVSRCSSSTAAQEHSNTE